jgi:hypothetical protein
MHAQHSFLIVTVSSGIIKALPGIVNNPTSVPNLLAENLPGASTFFLTYVILQGIAGSAAGVLQIVPLIIYYIKLIILGSTPRSIYGIKNNLRDVAWGTLFPSMSKRLTFDRLERADDSVIGLQLSSPSLVSLIRPS